jgi:hypothetical protein
LRQGYPISVLIKNSAWKIIKWNKAKEKDKMYVWKYNNEIYLKLKTEQDIEKEQIKAL